MLMSDFLQSNIVIQGLGVIGIIAALLSFQCKSHKKIVIFGALNEFFFMLQYILLGAYTGAAVNILGIIRNYTFGVQVAHNKNTNFSRLLFSVLFLVFGIATWGGWVSLLVIFAKIVSTLGYGFKKPFFVRLTVLPTCVCWLIYNWFAHSAAGVVCESLRIASILVGIVRIDILQGIKKKSANAANNA